MQPCSILTLGPLIVDIITSPMERMLRSGEGVATSVGIHPGGCSFNVSADCAKIGGDLVAVTAVGAVGDDIFREFFSRELTGSGVQPLLYPFPGERTGANIILQVHGDDRRFHTDAGANVLLDPELVLSEIDRLQPDCFYLGELSLMGACEQAIGELFRAARKNGALTVADVVVTEEADWNELFAAAPSIDLLHCNDWEAMLITGTSDVYSALQVFADRGFRLPVVSLGDKGCVWVWNGCRYLLGPFSCEQKDATGAGDAFVAGTIVSLLEITTGTSSGIRMSTVDDATLIDALVHGAAAGACAVTRIGCTGAVTKENIDRLLRRQEAEVRSSLRKEIL